jgi:hypothetical protein
MHLSRSILVFCFAFNSLCLHAAAESGLRRVDERRADRVGIRRVDGRHLRLYTDLPQGDAVDGLGNVFDAAVEEWADYFGIAPERTVRWRMQGFLIEDRAKFAALGLLPETNPDFVNGYCQGSELWLAEQPSDYYRRHLLLHEGTHGFMYAFLGERAPGWYMEGMAELLGTHRWQNGRLALRQLPANRDDVPMWGRIKLVRESRAMPLAAVLNLGEGRTLSTDEYGWCWALCKFLDSHPRLGDQFRRLSKRVNGRSFDKHFREAYRQQWSDLLFEWQAFVAALDYGYDMQRMTVTHRGASQVKAKAEITIAADRGWQSTGWRLQGGKSYTITATGRYEIAREQLAGASEPWPCEPGGVTLEYHGGLPLGMLLGLLRPVDGQGSTDFSEPLALGQQASITPQVDAVLYLRVNDRPDRLSDNEGTFRASIVPR